MNVNASILSALVGAAALLAANVPASSAPASQRYLVEFAAGKTANGKAAVKAAGGVIKRDLARSNAVAAYVPDAKVGALRSDPNVKLVEVDQVRYPISGVRSLPTGADRTAADQGASASQVMPYGVPMVQADQLKGNAGSGVKVCVIDSGYDITHEDKPQWPVVNGTDDLDGSGPWKEDGSSHGTHVSGTINALDNDIGIIGVFPSVPMHIVRVFGNDGNWAYSSDLIDAVDDCISNGANVINMSLGGERPSTLENAVFLKAQKAGVLAIAAAGNGGDGRSCDTWTDPSRPERQACKMQYPSGYASVMSVAAVDETSNIAAFSQVNSKVEIAAPGVGVLSTVPTGSMMDVTLTTTLGTTDVVPMDNFPIPAAPVSGYLLDCGKGLSKADCNGGSATGAVCLIERGDATFAVKAVSCEEAGGVAAVIYQRDGVDGPVQGTLGDTHVKIAVVGTDRATGLALKNVLGTPATVTFTVSGYDYDYFSGTSMATPHVAGVAALLRSLHPSCGPIEIRAAMNATAVDLATPGRDKYYGYGLVQAKDADTYLAEKGCTGQ